MTRWQSLHDRLWPLPTSRRSRATVTSTFRVYDGSEGQQTVDDGLMATVLRHRDFGKAVHWTPRTRPIEPWGAGTLPAGKGSAVLPLRRLAP